MTAPTPAVTADGQIYTHSLKLEDTSKGLRISVHVYTNDQEKAIEEAFNTYLKAKMTATDNKIPLAPVDNGK
jgi:hypothetical protein